MYRQSRGLSISFMISALLESNKFVSIIGQNAGIIFVDALYFFFFHRKAVYLIIFSIPKYDLAYAAGQNGVLHCLPIASRVRLQGNPYFKDGIYLRRYLFLAGSWGLRLSAYDRSDVDRGKHAKY